MLINLVLKTIPREITLSEKIQLLKTCSIIIDKITIWKNSKLSCYKNVISITMKVDDTHLWLFIPN
jgi:hypothetical protein